MPSERPSGAAAEIEHGAARRQQRAEALEPDAFVEAIAAVAGPVEAMALVECDDALGGFQDDHQSGTIARRPLAAIRRTAR